MDGSVRYLWSLRFHLACASKRALKRKEGQPVFSWVRMGLILTCTLPMLRFAFLSDSPKDLVRFVGLLSGEEAVSVAFRGRAKGVDEADISGN